MATPEKTKALAVAEIWKGRNTRDVAAEFGVTHVTVSRWVKDAGPPPAAPAPSSPSEPPDGPSAPMTIEAMLRVVQGQLESAVAIAEAAKGVGHYDAAAKALRQIGVIMPILLRVLEKVGDDRDVIKIPRAELEAAQRSNLERMKAYAAHPLHCFKCGREMRAQLAGLAKDAQARLFDPEQKRDDTK